ncbi:MAG: FAD-dependent monooxygenase [Alphaproteobacteria bacterium]|nr:FAD-dependent monooxygenase [Alphaproteobacteria bacterium]
MKVVIQGAGIAGLTLARALQQRAPRVEWTLVERLPTLQTAGAGITLGPNALRVLDALGLGEALRERGQPVRLLEVQDRSGRVLSAMRFPDADEFVLGIHRTDLHEVLAEGLPLTTGRSVASCGAGEVHLDDGSRLDADLVVGADGIGSSLRASLEPLPRIYAGYTCWRLVVDDPVGLSHGIELWGHGQRAGLLPIGPKHAPRLYAFLVENAPAGTPDAPTDRVDLAQRFSGFPPAVRAVIDALPADGALLHHDIESHAHPCWGRGALVLIGDAAHALTPNMGQGAAMAIEDAWELAGLLAREPVPADLPAALAAVRGARVRHVVQTSERIGRVAQWSHPLACWIRDTSARFTPDAVGEGQARRVFHGGPVCAAG